MRKIYETPISGIVPVKVEQMFLTASAGIGGMESLSNTDVSSEWLYDDND